LSGEGNLAARTLERVSHADVGSAGVTGGDGGVVAPSHAADAGSDVLGLAHGVGVAGCVHG